MDNSQLLKKINSAIKNNAARLNLKNSKLQFLPSEIANIDSLQELNVEKNYIRQFPKEISKLDNLISLQGKNNSINIFQKELCSLRNLEKIDLRQNFISLIPNEVGQLTKLKFLHLDNNLLTEIPVEIGNLINLEYLSLGESFDISIQDIPKLRTSRSNQISVLPSEMGRLTNLKILYATSNKIQAIPAEFGNLASLEEVYLNYNNISQLPVTLKNLKKLKILDLRGNPLPIPPEILEKINEPEIILNYYFQIFKYNLAEGDDSRNPPSIEVSVIADEFTAQPINEIKLILVGQGSVGKTSLVNRILYGKFNENQNKTPGISINQWNVFMSQDTVSKMLIHDSLKSYISKPLRIHHNPNIKINIWDFGGQEIMHATHQFFLTNRSLYLLVLDSRLTQEENRVEYWLKIIQSFGDKSSIIIVGNKTDQHPLDIDYRGLKKKYKNIVGIIEVSALTGTGIESLKTKILENVETMPHVRDFLPGSWFTVKSKIEELAKEKNYFTQDEYFALCNTNKVNDETSKRTLISFLHDLGVVLHFQDDPRLANLGILNPQWVTNGVYKILNSHELFQNQGKLTLPLLNQILDSPEYPINKRLFIVDMMKKFELCYDIEPDKTFLIPDLLPKDEPFTGEWEDALAFQIHYDVLPSSIISRFIVRMNEFIHKTIWRSGVVLKHGENTALVKADIEDKKIYIWVSGEKETRRDLLAIIRAEFEKIHKTIAKIEATEKVPVPDIPEAVPVDYEFLVRMANEGRESLPVQAGNQIIDLIVKEVLSRIETQNKNYQLHIHGDVIGGNIISGEKNQANVENIEKKKPRKKKS